MIELTQEQRHAIAGVESLVILDPETKQSYILVRKEVFDRIKGLLYDDSEWTSEEQQRLLAALPPLVNTFAPTRVSDAQVHIVFE